MKICKVAMRCGDGIYSIYIELCDGFGNKYMPGAAVGSNGGKQEIWEPNLEKDEYVN